MVSSENEVEQATESEEEPQKKPYVAPKAQGQRTMQRARQNRPKTQIPPEYSPTAQQQNMVPAQDQRLTGNMGGATGAVRQSRIKDRPQPKDPRDSSLKIKIELDLEVEVDLYARVKGDITIGLM